MGKSLFRSHLEASTQHLLRSLGRHANILDTKSGPGLNLHELAWFEDDAEKFLNDRGSYVREVLRALPEFMQNCVVYRYPKPDVTTDAVVFGLDLDEGKLNILLIRRGREDEPFYDHWALPGGFLNMDEGLGKCARRELREETGVEPSYMEQLFTFGHPDRDPRGRVVTVAHMALVRPDQVTVKADDDAKDAQWFNVDNLPPLAFDHDEIIDMGLRRLRGKLRWQPIGVDLLDAEFTLSDLQQVYEVILGHSTDKRNFRRKVLSFGVLEETGGTRSEGHRPAKLYSFSQAAYDKLRREGLDFEV